MPDLGRIRPGSGAGAVAASTMLLAAMALRAGWLPDLPPHLVLDVAAMGAFVVIVVFAVVVSLFLPGLMLLLLGLLTWWVVGRVGRWVRGRVRAA